MFAREGVKLLAGTDTPLPIMFPGHSLHDDIDEFRAAGLSPFDALAAMRDSVLTANRTPEGAGSGVTAVSSWGRPSYPLTMIRRKPSGRPFESCLSRYDQ